MFGTKTVWRNDRKIQISDPHKTIIDMLHNPQVGGGIHHVIDCIKEYLKSNHYDADLLISYAKQMKNGTVFKRLGYIAECLLGNSHKLTKLSHLHITKGYSYLDPEIKKANLVTRWHLFVPEGLRKII